MLARLRRNPAPPPVIHEPPAPPPPAAARKAKERSWLASLSRGGRAEPLVERETGDRGGAPSVRSRRSVRSFRFGGFSGGKGRHHAVGGREDGAAEETTGSAMLAPPQSGATRYNVGVAASKRVPATPPTRLAPPSARPLPPGPTVSLAQRLQELAVANADGLLDEDEYRILRGQLFETTGGGEGGTEVSRLGEGRLAVPSLEQLEKAQTRGLSTITPSSSSGMQLSPEAAARRASSTSAQLAPPLEAPQRAPSVASTARRKGTSGLTALLRRSSSASVRSGVEPLSDEWTHVVSPLVDDGASVHSRRSSHQPATGPSSTPTYSPPLAGAISTRSIRQHAGLSSSAFSPRTHSSGSSPELGVVSRSGRSAASTVITPSPASQARAKFSPALSHISRSSHGSSSRYAFAPLPAIPSATDPALLAAAASEPGADELRVEIGEIEAEWMRMREAWEEMIRAKVEKWEREVGEDVAWGLWSRPLREGIATGRSHVLADGLTLAATASLPAASPSATKHAARDLPPFLARSLPAPVPPGLPEDIDLLTRVLQRRVRELQERESTTDDKYGRRLDFLRAKLRAAQIRDRLS